MELNFVGKLNSLAIKNRDLAFDYKGQKADFYLYSDTITINDSQIKVNRINFNLSEMEPYHSLGLTINNDRVIYDDDDFIIIDLFLDKAYLVFRCDPELDTVGDFKLIDNMQKKLLVEYISINNISGISCYVNGTSNTTNYPQILDIWVIEYDGQKENVLQWIYENVAI